MPVTFKILQDPLLVYIRYSGHLVTSDIRDAVTQFAQGGAAYHGQPHLFDLSRVTSSDINYPEFFAFMGQLADVYPMSKGENLFVFYAPDGPPAALSQILRKPFEQTPTMLVRAASTREQAFDILGNEREDLREQLDEVE